MSKCGEISEIILPGGSYHDSYYETSHKNIGNALIFNQVKFEHEKEREGSTKDEEDLKTVFLNFGFKVEVCRDFTTQQIKNRLYIGEIKSIEILIYCFKYLPFFYTHRIRTRSQRK